MTAAPRQSAPVPDDVLDLRGQPALVLADPAETPERQFAAMLLADLRRGSGATVTWLNHYSAMQSLHGGVQLDRFDYLGLDGILLCHLLKSEAPRTSADLVLPLLLEHPVRLRIALIGSTQETLHAVAAKIEAQYGHRVVLLRDGYALFAGEVSVGHGVSVFLGLSLALYALTSSITFTVLAPAGLTGAIFRSTAVGALAVVVGIAILSPLFGAVGGAASVAVAQAAALAAQVPACRRVLRGGGRSAARSPDDSPPVVSAVP